MPASFQNRPGFQGSETSNARVHVYQHGDDPIILNGIAGATEIEGRRASDPSSCLVSVQTSKALGAPSGSFVLTVKGSKAVGNEVFEWLADDDWIDVVFYRHDQPWHVMRGLVDEVRQSTVVSGTGATVETYTISGRDFAKIWEITPVWFSPYADNDLVTDAVGHKTFDALPSVVGDPPTAVKAYLKSFLEAVSQNAGVNWNPPKGMPAIENDSFLESVGFDDSAYSNIPARKQFNPNYMMPSGTLWQLAQQHSDPLFTELYADLLPNNDAFAAELASGDPVGLGDAKMTVVIRDKPFPNVAESGKDDNWGGLPLAIVPRQQIKSADLGKSGLERFNAFFVASLLHQEQTGKDALSIIAPLINLEEIKRHGMRRMDVQSQMAPDALDFGVMAEQQRKIIRDWYALNPYLISGTINLGMGRPDIRIGTRIAIPGVAADQSDMETYYVEQVSHSWQYGSGLKTTLGVTRGWIGDDSTYRDALEKKAAQYTIPKLRKDQ